MLSRIGVLLFLAVPALAQVTETIEVAVTSVDVVVTDGKGNRVRGLTRDDFEILVGGKPQEITNFSEYSDPATSVIVPSAVTPAPGPVEPATQVTTPPLRRLLFVIDNNSLTMRNRRPAMAAAQEFVDRSVRSGDLVLVSILSGAFTPRLDWSGDKEEIKRVLAAIAEESTIGRQEIDRRRTEQEFQRMLEISSQGGGALRYRFGDFMALGRTYAERVFQDARHSLSLLSAVVRDFARYPEKKAMIFIGEGLDASPGFDIFQMLETLKMQVESGQTGGAALRQTARGFQPMNEAGRYSMSGALHQFAAVAYRKGVPIYAINPGTNEDAAGAVERTSLADTSADFANVISKMAGYQVVAAMSGGASFIGQRPDKAFSQIASDLGSYYSLGFRAAGPLKNPGAVRVRTRRGGYRVRMVMGGIPETTEERVEEAVVAHHVTTPGANELQIALATQPGVAAGGKKQVKLLVLIPVRQLALVRQGAELTGGFDVYLSIGTAAGDTSGVNKQTHTIRWPAEALPALIEKKLTYAVDVTLEPGSTQISVGVVDHGSKKVGFERVGV